MAINTQKFLPSKKYELGNYLGGNNVGTKSLKSKGSRGESSQLLEVKNKIIQVEKLISSTTLLKSYEAKQKRKDVETKKRAKRESELEKDTDTGKDAIKTPDIPGLGFLDRVKKFFLSILFGFIAYRLVDYLPQFVKFVSIATPAFKFLETFTGSLFGSLVNLIDKGYQFVDKTEKLIKDFGGEEALKNFDKFEGILKGFINSALLFKMLLPSNFSKILGEILPGGITAASGAGSVATKRALAKRIQETAFGKRTVIPKKTVVPTKQLTAASTKISPELSGVRTFIGVGGKANIADPTIQEFVQKLEKRAATGEFSTSGKTVGKKVIEKAAAKGGSKFIGKAVPFVGPLIDFIISTVVFREKPTRAAAGAVGGLVGSLITGGLLGAGTFGLGAGIGAFVGGFAGDLIGRALYDAVESISGKKYAGGGSVRRGKTPTPSRTIRPSKRSLKIQSSPVKPGVDVGGEKKINKVFPKSQTERQVSPYDFMKKSAKIMSSTDAFGPLFDLQSKALLGQKPSSTDYRNAAQGLNAWMSNTFSEGIVRGGMAFANGGSVDASMMMGDDMTSWIEASIRRFVSPKVDNVIKELLNNIQLKLPGEYGEKIQEQEGGIPGQMAPGSVPGGQLTIEQLVGLAKGAGFSADEAVIMAAIAMAESGGNSNRTNFVPPDKSYGLWQINMIGGLGPARLQQFGLSSESQLLDPVTNAKAAYAIRRSQGLDAWTVYKTKAYKNFLSQAQSARNAPSLAKSPFVTDAVGYSGYITGDPSHPNYRADHSGANYHDHLSFKDRATAERAYKFFQSKGFKVTEFKGYGNVGTHSPGSLHYSGLAFDIPGEQVPVGQETRMSARVRKTLSEFNTIKQFAKGGRVSKPTRALIGEKGPEFIFDADTTKGLDQMMPNLLENLNAAKNKSQLMSVLMSYTDYEDMGEQTITVELPPPQVVVEQVPVPMGGSIAFSGGSDPFANLAAL